MEERRIQCDSRITALQIDVTRLEEKLIASDHALELARAALQAWQVASNEWRQENIDQRSQYMSIDKAQALVSTETALRYALEARVLILEQTQQREVGKHSASSAIWAVVATIVTLIISATALVVHFK